MAATPASRSFSGATSAFAALAVAGLGVGLALQGALSNLAGGVLIIVFKPFKIGDLVDAHDEIGFVKDINIFTTQIVTPDNKRVIIPNGNWPTAISLTIQQEENYV